MRAAVGKQELEAFGVPNDRLLLPNRLLDSRGHDDDPALQAALRDLKFSISPLTKRSIERSNQWGVAPYRAAAVASLDVKS